MSHAMLQDLIGQKVVIDLRGPFVCLGRLVAFDAGFLDVHDADLHDLRDTQTTRENYIVSSKRTGIKANRKRTLIAREEMIAISRFKDVIDD
jgi:small nuclear ribonucleoprotein (snRNP)-like protein